ncbi:MAG: hypothetical protein EXS68_02840 [Candidatus Ryanbacteria bacterium]|nr:hypothetical protein [Candidatus Ryanbacteria bacterium]
MRQLSLHAVPYYAATFVAGFSLMVIEVTSSRIVAPMIGSSIFTWTSVIGVTLLGLSIGSFLGGWLADRYTKSFGHKVAALAFICAAFFVYTILPLSPYVSGFFRQSFSLMELSVMVSAILFLAPAIAMGALAPIIFKSFVDSVSDIGKKYGFLSGIWSLGSIVGVFATGFYFIPTIGSAATVRLIVFVLATIFYIFYLQDIKRQSRVSGGDVAILAIVTVCLAVLVISSSAQRAPESKKILFHKETAYYDLRVVDYKLFPTYGDNRILFLDIDTHSVQTARPSQRFYTDAAPAFAAFSDSIKNIYVIGAGAYTLPINLKKQYPDAKITVGEIDPEIAKVGTEYFNVGAYDIETEIGDARVRFARTGSMPAETFDLIYGDAYNSFISVPWYLLTQEFNENIKNYLSPNGVYAVNFAGTLEGPNAVMFESIYATMRSTFPDTYILAFGRDYTKTQNITILGTKSGVTLSHGTLVQKFNTLDKNRFLSSTLVDASTISVPTRRVLTDDFAPIEYMMTGLMREYFPTYIELYKKVVS